MGSEEAMVTAAASLNGTELDGRSISVRLESEGRPADGGRPVRAAKHEEASAQST